MKIALIAQPLDMVLPPEQNSIGLIAYHTARRLAVSHDVTVYAPNQEQPGGAAPEAFRFEGVSTSLDETFLRVKDRYPSIFGSRPQPSSPAYYRRYFRKVARKLGKENVDVVHVFNFPQAIPLIRRRGVRAVIGIEMQGEWLSQWDSNLVSGYLDGCNVVWGVSDHIKNLVAQRFPRLPVAYLKSFNGVDTGIFRDAGEEQHALSHDNLRLVFVGRVSPEKGIHVLIEAMAEVVRQVPGVKLDIVGPRTQLPVDFLAGISDDANVRTLKDFYDGTVCTDYQAHLDGLIQKYGLTQAVTFVGSMPQRELAPIYKKATLLVNPSYSESFGMSLVEAMACGVPVVATRIGGMKEIVEPGKTGELVSAGNAAQLAKAIVGLLSTRESYLDMARSAALRAKDVFSWQARAGRLEDGYAQALSAV